MNSIRVGAVVDPPYIRECFTDYPKRCTKPGMDVEYLHTLISGIHKLNITWRNYDSIEILEKALNNNEIDII